MKDEEECLVEKDTSYRYSSTRGRLEMEAYTIR